MYTVGSIPFAYILSLRAGVDLRLHGSRNIGARNAFEVTKRKDIGFAVLVLDFLKGMIPTLLADHYFYEPPILPLALVMLVVGHCYPAWLRFHGGRGLATAAGILTVAAPFLVSAWLVLYVVTKMFSTDVHLRTVMALLATLPLVFVSNLYSGRTIYMSRNVAEYGIVPLQVGIAIMIGVILTRHIGPILQQLGYPNRR